MDRKSSYKMKLKYMLPITAIAGAAAIVTPLAVSCGQKSVAKLTYNYNAQWSSNSNDSSYTWEVNEFQHDKSVSKVEYSEDMEANEYNDSYVNTVVASPIYICDGFAQGYNNLLTKIGSSQAVLLGDILSINGAFTTEILNAKYIMASESSISGYSSACFDLKITNDQIITYGDLNGQVSSAHVQYTLSMSGIEFSLTNYGLTATNIAGGSMSFVNTFVNKEYLDIDEFDITAGYDPIGHGDFGRLDNMTEAVNNAINNDATNNFAINFDYKVSDATTGSLIQSSNIQWTKGTAAYSTGSITLGNITCADVLLTMAFGMQNAYSIDC